MALKLGFLAALSIALAFVSQWITLVTVGPGRETDALFAGLVVPQLLVTILGTALARVLMPVLAETPEREFENEVWTLLHTVAMVFATLIVLLGVTAPWWVPLTVPGFAPDDRLLTISLLRVQLLSSLNSALLAVMTAACHARREFVRVEAATILGAAATVGLLFIGVPRFGVQAAAWAQVVRTGLPVLALLPRIGRYRRPRWQGPAVRKTWGRMRPLLLGSTYYKTEDLVDRALASLAPPGELSLFYLARQMHGIGLGVLNRSLIAPVLPDLAERARTLRWDDFVSLLRKRLQVVLVLVFAAVAALLVIGRPLLTLIFSVRSFDRDQVVFLWWLMLAMAGLAFAGAAGDLLANSFYVRGDTRTPTLVGVVGFTLGLGLKFVGFNLGGIRGLAIATSTYYSINASVLYLLMRRKIRAARQVRQPAAGETVSPERSNALDV